MCCLVLRSNFALLLTIQFASLISSLINIISLLLTTFDWTKVRGIAPRSHTGRPRTCLVKDWGCNTETVNSIYLFIFLGKYYALSCLNVLKEWSKENCDKKPINSYSCKYLYSTHFTINKLKSWVLHTYYYISSSKLNCCIFSCLTAFQRTQIVPKPLSGLVKLRLLGLPANTKGRDITLVAAD